MKILREEDRGCKPGPAAWFSGIVWLDEVVVSPPLKVTRVGFAPGARTAWHTHPRGQALHVLSGVCQIQLRGEEVQTVSSGDSVWIEPGEVHWHGSAPGRTMVHLAMQEPDESGVDVVWLEHVDESANA
jgi:quercetin dioxygenase-like cupin family protein